MTDEHREKAEGAPGGDRRVLPPRLTVTSASSARVLLFDLLIAAADWLRCVIYVNRVASEKPLSPRLPRLLSPRRRRPRPVLVSSRSPGVKELAKTGQG